MVCLNALEAIRHTCTVQLFSVWVCASPINNDNNSRPAVECVPGTDGPYRGTGGVLEAHRTPVLAVSVPASARKALLSSVASHLCVPKPSHTTTTCYRREIQQHHVSDAPTTQKNQRQHERTAWIKRKIPKLRKNSKKCS